MKSDIASKLKDNFYFINGVVSTNLKGEELRDAYNFFRISVLDGIIPIKKAIGFKLFSSTNMQEVAAIDRHSSCLENMMELSKNVSKLIFVSPTGFAVSSEERTGEVTASKAGFHSDGKKVKLVDDTCYLFNSTEPLGIRIFAHENSGSHLMEENVVIMRSLYGSEREESSTFFPLNTEHDLLDYLRVLPFDGHIIKYRLQNGFKVEDLTVLWNNYIRGCLE